MGDLITQSDIKEPALQRRADLADLITEASDLIEGWCNRTFALATGIVELYSGNALGRLFLRRPPIVQVSTVTINGVDLDNTDGLAWSLRADTGELRRGPAWIDLRFCSRFPAGLDNVTVTYDGGYSIIPPRIQRACKVLCKHLADVQRTPGQYKHEKIGSYEYDLNTDSGGIPEPVLRMIEGFVI